MAVPTFKSAEPSGSTKAAFAFHDDASHRLYQLQHLFSFIADIAEASELNAQVNGLKTESVQVVFGWLALEIESLREDEFQQLREAIPRDREWLDQMQSFKGAAS